MAPAPQICRTVSKRWWWQFSRRVVTQTALEMVLVVKLIQINAWQGRLGDSLAKFIEQEKPDIICMQEAYIPGEDLIPALAYQYNFLDKIRAASGLQNEFFAKGWNFMLGTNIVEAGSVILSRYPISDHQEFHPFNHHYTAEGKHNSLNNTQAWQACTLTLPGGQTLSLSNYHGYLEDVGGVHGMGTEKTVEVMKKVADKLEQLPRPLIFAGDLNIWPESPAFREFDKLGLVDLGQKFGVRGTLSAMHRASDADKDISTPDHILVSSEVQVQKFTVSDEIVSDHKALILEFDI